MSSEENDGCCRCKSFDTISIQNDTFLQIYSHREMSKSKFRKC